MSAPTSVAAAAIASQLAVPRATRGISRAGFGLVELIVALMILSVGLLALTGAAAVAQRSLINAQALEESTEVAEVVLDSLMRVSAPAAGERTIGRTEAQWTIHSDSAAVAIHLTATVTAGTATRQITFRATHHAR